MTLGNLTGISALADVESRSISAENPTGEPGQGARRTEGTGAHAARDLGQGWKVSPSIEIGPGETATLADIAGSGCITHIWLTTHVDHWRRLVFRGYWDGDAAPAIETPVGDFFCSGWGRFAQVNSLPVAVNPIGGFNCYWEMPFQSQAQLTIENTHDEPVVVYFQVDYWLGAVPDKSAYLHAQWRRSNPLQSATVHTLLDGVEGPGHYVGTYIAWGVNSSGWWGEGEVKFYVDSDDEFPTICGTGTED
ncbi:hypothetical protein GCM10009804_06790 [Kribbella hippodromi]|uniref:DUF2961 domain-containing protein n=1 Tax=Kribbella hippodromi TaxID=434347 RepID=A0ABP4MYG8_9ACTN